MKDFKDRAKLPYNVLKEYGYSNTEIIKMKDILKKENLNVVDIIKNALSATLTLSLIGLSTSKSQYVLGFSFSWSSRPFYLYDDLIAFAWEASGVNGIPINAAINTSQSYLTVKYTAVNGSIASNDLNKSITAIQGYHSAKVKFKEGERMLTGTGIYWAYYGTGKIYIDAVVSETIYELLFSIAYGHTIFSIHPSVSISFGDGSAVFDFNTSCNQEAIITKRYGYNGSVTTL